MCRLIAVYTKLSKLQTVAPRFHPSFSNCRLVRTMSVSESPYGSWKSPISSKMVSESSVSFQEVHLDTHDPEKTDKVYWSEMRYSEGGRYVICAKQQNDSESGDPFEVWTPKDFNSRTKVHEYGGGAFFVWNDKCFFTNFSDQRMYVQEGKEGSPVPVVSDQPDAKWRYADGQYSHKNNQIYVVKEEHAVTVIKEVKAAEAKNSIVAVDPENQQQTVLAEGADFYSSPRVSPDGTKIAWIQWNHPNMPWDSTELWVSDLIPGGKDIKRGSEKKVAGGDGVSVMQPGWTMNNELLYISDVSDWWNLYHVTSSGAHVNLMPKEVELGGPQWVFGNNAYVVDPSGSGKVITLYGGELGSLDMTTGKYSVLIPKETYSCSKVNISPSGVIYCEAGSPTKFSRILRVTPQLNKEAKWKVLRFSKEVPKELEGHFSIPEEISWSTTDGDTAYGYFYPPKNRDFHAPSGTLPPLLVKAHGGPTGQASSTLNLKMQYFTSRGFALLDVNYRGSTGYGKKYRNKLRGKWGVYDLDDCCSGAQYLAKEGRVDPACLCIDGGSAGGYTTLSCLTFRPTVFKAGCSHYGVADLEALAKDTHKFESRYLDTVVAPYSGDDIQIYRDRSPINFVKDLNCALAFFQGDEDKIVPPSQAERMYNAVKAKKLPTMYILFPGEQHGFRKSENIQKALDGEFYFFSKVFGFEPADKHCKLKIDNL